MSYLSAVLLHVGADQGFDIAHLGRHGVELCNDVRIGVLVQAQANGCRLFLVELLDCAEIIIRSFCHGVSFCTNILLHLCTVSQQTFFKMSYHVIYDLWYNVT